MVGQLYLLVYLFEHEAENFPDYKTWHPALP